MKRFYLILGVIIMFSISTPAQQKSDNGFNFKWNNGFNLVSSDKNFNLKFGGRIQLDHAFLSQDDDLDFVFGELPASSGIEFRRARFFMSGTIYNNVSFKLQFEYAGGKTVFKDAYIGLKDIPLVGNLRIGHVKEPFSLDALTSSKYNTFMERGMPYLFTLGRNTGILFFNDFLDKRLSIQTGLFRETDNTNGNIMVSNGGYSFTTRITSLLFNNKKDRKLVHIGAAYSYRKPDAKNYGISTRPEAHLSPFKYISIGTIDDVNKIHVLNFEAAVVVKSFAFQAEYFESNVHTLIANQKETYNFSGYYAEVSYFLTGESKAYKNSYSGFGRVKPNKNYGDTRGSGAWEIALRISNVDLNSKTIEGGQQSDITLGLNWYLNPATGFTFNNVWANVKGLGNANIMQVRFQIDF